MPLKIFNRNTVGAIEKGVESMIAKGGKQAATEGSTVLSDALAKLSPEAKKVVEAELRYGGKLGNVGHGIFTIEKPCGYMSGAKTTKFFDLQTGRWLKNRDVACRINGQYTNLSEGVNSKNLPNLEFYRCDTFKAPESYQQMFNFNPAYMERPTKEIHQLRQYNSDRLAYYHRKVTYGDRMIDIGGSRSELLSSKVYNIKNGTYEKSIESSAYGGCGPLGSAHEIGRMSVLGEGSKTWRGFQLFPEYAGFYKNGLGNVDCIG